jgi:hypothetical protein
LPGEDEGEGEIFTIYKSQYFKTGYIFSPHSGLSLSLGEKFS